MSITQKQIGWSQEAILLHAISKQLERLGGVLASSGGSAVGALQVLGGGPVTATLQRVTDTNNNLTGLYIATNQITSYGVGGPASFGLAFGDGALKAITSGLANVAYGGSALTNVTTSSFNTAIGGSAMEAYNDPDGAGTKGQNVVMGSSAMRTAVAGKWNTVIGTSAMQFSNSGGGFNVVIGAHAGENSQGSQNILIGFYAGSVTTGSNNILIENGATSGGGVTTGTFNTIINPRNKTGITTGSNNTIIGGYNASISNVSDFVIIGTGAGTTRLAFDNLGQMSISTAPTQGTGAATEKVLVRDSTTGFVKQIENVVTNGTASALTAATLNATYTTATLGFRVVCTNIAGANVIYVKTGASSWASIPITNVV